MARKNDGGKAAGHCILMPTDRRGYRQYLAAADEHNRCPRDADDQVDHPLAVARFYVTLRRQQPQWARRALGDVCGRTKQRRRYRDGLPAPVHGPGGRWSR